MLDGVRIGLTLSAALGSGLIGGVLFTFSTFAMKALHRLPPAQGIAAMQQINVTVLTPWFLGPFLGTAAGCAVLGALSLGRLREPGAALALGGSVLYVVGVLGVTVACNIPRNDALDAVEPNSAEGAALWARYVPEWPAWNTARTVAALAAAAMLTVALVLGYGRDGG